MNKKVVVISSSLRLGSNSEVLAQAFVQGAQAAGNIVEEISLKEKDLRFCTGCLACQSTARCWMQDDSAAINAKLKEAEVVVFATPVYFYAMSGQLKTLLDRTNPLFTQSCAFRDVYLLMSAAEEDPQLLQPAIHELEGWISCFEQAQLAGVVAGGGLSEPSAVSPDTKAYQEAYQMGLHC